MSLVLTRGGSLLLLGAQQAYLQTLTLRLFKNDHPPVETDDVFAFDEATFTGYAAVPTTGWGMPALDAAFRAQIVEVLHTFACTGPAVPNTIFGYYLTDPAGRLVWAEYGPPGGQIMDGVGKVYLVQPRLTDRTDPG